MLKTFFTSVLLGLITCSARAGIDFTPSVHEYTSQGIAYRQVRLKTDTGVVTFVPPLGWEVRGTKDRLQMEPAGKNFSELTASARSLAQPLPFDGATVERLKQEVLTSTPASSAAAQIISCEQNTMMGGNPSVEIVVSYAALGRTFQRSVLYVRTATTEMVFRFTAPKTEFAALNQAFRQSISSWQWVEPKTPGRGHTAVAGATQPTTSAN